MSTNEHVSSPTIPVMEQNPKDEALVIRWRELCGEKAIVEKQLRENLAVWIDDKAINARKKIGKLLAERAALEVRRTEIGHLIQDAQIELQGRRNRFKATNLHTRFIDVAKVFLDKATFDKILDRAKELAREDEQP